MTRRHTTEFTVEFGDCDPAQIVFYPNFLRWMDAAARHYFSAVGVPSWRETAVTFGVIGTPLVDVQAKFLRPASYGDTIAVDTTVVEWGNKSFTMTHVIRRGDVVLVEGREVRVFARRHPDDPARIQAVPAPESIRALCDAKDPA